MYSAVSLCMLMQDTADANSMLLTIAVNEHNCVAIRRFMAMDGNATQHAASSI